MAPIYKIALIQMQPKPVDPAANFATASGHIRAAASQGCHLAVLPEYHLTGWVPSDQSFVSSSAASNAYLAQYQALARDLDISIVPGTICEVVPQGDDGTPPELRNMAYFVSAGSGAILGSYQKKNLWHPERPHLAAGTAAQPHAAFDAPSLPRLQGGRAARVGLLVCWDVAFPEAFRALVADGADVVVVPSCWAMDDVDEEAQRLGGGDSERVFLESCVVARACENAVAVVFVNTAGLSQVAMPLLGPVGGVVEPGVEGMKVVEVDMDVLRVAEGNYKVREDMRKEGWHYGYTLPPKGTS